MQSGCAQLRGMHFLWANGVLVECDHISIWVFIECTTNLMEHIRVEIRRGFMNVYGILGTDLSAFIWSTQARMIEEVRRVCVYVDVVISRQHGKYLKRLTLPEYIKKKIADKIYCFIFFLKTRYQPRTVNSLNLNGLVVYLLCICLTSNLKRKCDAQRAKSPKRSLEVEEVFLKV